MMDELNDLFESPIIRNASEHNVKKFLEKNIKKNIIKNCAQAKVKKDWPRCKAASYFLDCEKGSFEWENNGWNKYYFRGCPANCLCYQAKWKGALNDIVRNFLKRMIFIFKKPFIYFSSLGERTQSRLIVVLILLVIYKILGLETTLKIINAILPKHW